MKGSVVTPVLLAILGVVVVGSHVHAGKETVGSGEQCWGVDCVESEKEIPSTAGGGSSSDSSSGFLPGNITTHDCNAADRDQIASAISWLEYNLAAIDDTMRESPHLMFWPGNTRRNFGDKFDKTLKFYCISQKNKCDPEPDGRLLGKTYPGVAQSRINLCTDNLRAVAFDDSAPVTAIFARTIAHEIGHLIRANLHRTDCVRSFVEPRFSRALGYAAEYGYRGIPYDPGFYVLRCGQTTSSTGNAGSTGGTSYIEWKRTHENSKPPLQAR